MVDGVCNGRRWIHHSSLRCAPLCNGVALQRVQLEAQASVRRPRWYTQCRVITLMRAPSTFQDRARHAMLSALRR